MDGGVNVDLPVCSLSTAGVFLLFFSSHLNVCPQHRGLCLRQCSFSAGYDDIWTMAKVVLVVVVGASY